MEKLAVDFDGQLMDAFIKKTDIRSQLDRPGVNPIPILDEIASPVTIHDIQALATLMLKDQMLVLQTLLHDAMPIQEALLLLRISSTHKLDYLLRCVPPSAMEKLAVDFDGQLMDAFIKKTDILSQLDSSTSSEGRGRNPCTSTNSSNS